MIKWIFVLFPIFAFADDKAKDQAVIDELVCPKQGDQFISLSKKTYSSMMDILLSYETQKKQISEFYLTTLEMKSSNPDHVDAIRKIKEVKSGQNQKIIRAKQTYNDNVVLLSADIPKTKRCWKYIPEASKNEVTKYLDAFQTKKVLVKFKECLRSQGTLISEHEKRLDYAIKFFNKTISRYTLLSEVKKIDARLDYREKYTNKQCEQMLESGFDSNFLIDPAYRPKSLEKEGKPDPNKPKFKFPELPSSPLGF